MVAKEHKFDERLLRHTPYVPRTVVDTRAAVLLQRVAAKLVVKMLHFPFDFHSQQPPVGLFDDRHRDCVLFDVAGRLPLEEFHNRVALDSTNHHVAVVLQRLVLMIPPHYESASNN